MADNAETGNGDIRQKRGWNPSRGFWLGMTAVAIFAGVLAAAGAYAASSEPEAAQFQAPDAPAPTVQVSHAPRKTTPPDDLTSNQQSNPSVVSVPSDPTGTAPSVENDGGAAPAGGAGTVVVEDGQSSSTVVSPTPVASSMSQSPVYVPPAPAEPLGTSAAALVAYAENELGIEIVTDGQDWGDNDDDQSANVGAVVSAWQRLPLQVTSSIVQHPHGTLKVLSNEQGRTEGGWQPHGDVATSFYTNSDQGVEGYRLSHQVVLATGANEETVLHELLHGYSLRNVEADDYAAVFLQDEMKSFMAATGWELVVSESDLVATMRHPWDAINALFAQGASSCFDAANPLEAFATAGAHYYGGNEFYAGCPEFNWFAENLS